MKISPFDPPGSVGDLGTAALKTAYSNWLSERFDVGVTSVTRFITTHGGGTCQFYNPVTHGRIDADLVASAGDITWNGFPKRFLSTVPGVPTRFGDAEPTPAVGQNRPEDRQRGQRSGARETDDHAREPGRPVHVRVRR